MSTPVIGHQAQETHEQALEDFASEAVAAVARPVPASETGSRLAPHGTCVNCGGEVTLRVVAIEGTRRTYQWVPSDEPARPGRRCYEAALPAYHWADGATAAVYHVPT
jgi:hypothetical protein